MIIESQLWKDDANMLLIIVQRSFASKLNARSLIHRVSMITDPEERPSAVAFRLIRPPLPID